MKYGMMPRLMWAMFRGSFAKQLPRLTDTPAGPLMEKAHRRYQEILAPIPKFEKGDRFLVNIFSASMLSAVLLELPERPAVEAVEDYYHHAMTDNAVMKLFLKKGGRYTAKAQEKLAQQARDSGRRSAANPYTWRFTYEPGPGLNSYTANFTHCGILHLLDTLGLGEYVPAMCTYDYDMVELGGSIFTRKYTLAGGGPCCDCHYRKGTRT